MIFIVERRLHLACQLPHRANEPARHDTRVSLSGKGQDGSRTARCKAQSSIVPARPPCSGNRKFVQLRVTADERSKGR